MPSSLTRPALLRALLAAGFVLLIAVCAQITVPMTPVPMTMQTFAVLLAGAALGPIWGGGAVLGYLALAALGLPILSDGSGGIAPFTGATAGYLVAFPIAAAWIGVLSQRPPCRRPLPAFSLMVGGHVLILSLGAGWLATRIGLTDALAAGLTPFIIGALVKSALVVAAAAGLRRLAVFRP